MGGETVCAQVLLTPRLPSYNKHEMWWIRERVPVKLRLSPLYEQSPTDWFRLDKASGTGGEMTTGIHLIEIGGLEGGTYIGFTIKLPPPWILLHGSRVNFFRFCGKNGKKLGESAQRNLQC